MSYVLATTSVTLQHLKHLSQVTENKHSQKTAHIWKLCNPSHNEWKNKIKQKGHGISQPMYMQFIICKTSLVLQQVPFLQTQAAMRYLMYPKPRSIMSFVSRQLDHGNAIYIGLPKLSKYHPIHPKSSSPVDFTHWIQCWTFSIGYLLRAGSTLREYPLSYYWIHKIPAPLYCIFSTLYAAQVDWVSPFQKENLSLHMLAAG